MKFKLGWTLLLCASPAATALAQNEPLQSYFRCNQSPAIRPSYMQVIDGGDRYKDWAETAKGLLGQNPMGDLAECESAVAAANAEAGVICSRTGLDGWKPTIYTGTRPGRRDFGYLGGSSIMNFEHCLQATRHSSDKGVCFWGGYDWYVSPIDREDLVAGPFDSIDDCTAYTAASPD